MPIRDAGWAVQQYEAVRAFLPSSQMPRQSRTVENLGEIAHHFDAFLLDAFGVLNVGNSEIPGATERVRQLQEMGKRVMVLTNSATFPAEQTLQKFAHLGFDFGMQDIVSSRDALTLALQDQTDAGAWGIMSAANSDEETLGVPFRRLGSDPTDYDGACGFVLLSTADWSEKQQELLQESLLRTPRPVFVGNPDIVAPRETGLTLEPGYYAYQLAQRLRLHPAFYGKPFGNIFDIAFSRLPDVDPKRVAMVGDTLHTDILGGAAYGVQTVLVTDHGLFSGFDHQAFITQTGIVPNYVIPNI